MDQQVKGDNEKESCWADFELSYGGDYNAVVADKEAAKEEVHGDN
jgi:hypothetical protein